MKVPMVETAVSRKKHGFHHKDLRRNLIEVATEAVEKSGADTVNIRELAKQLGVTHVALYRHFRDKAALLSAVAESGFQRLHAAQISARDAAGDDPLEGMIAMGQAYIDFARSNTNLFSFMFSREELTQRDPQGTLRDIVAQVEKCQTAGQMIDVPSGKIIGAIVSAPHGFAAFSAIGWMNDPAEGAELPSSRALLMLSLHPFLINGPSVYDILNEPR